MLPYSRPKLFDLYTLSQSKLLENHTLHSGIYPHSPYMAVPPGSQTAISVALEPLNKGAPYKWVSTSATLKM